MEKIELSNEDWSMIIESLKYTKIKFEDYSGYPSQEFKMQRIDSVVRVLQKIAKIRSGSLNK
jgi:hypothetical protein